MTQLLRITYLATGPTHASPPSCYEETPGSACVASPAPAPGQYFVIGTGVTQEVNLGQKGPQRMESHQRGSLREQGGVRHPRCLGDGECGGGAAVVAGAKVGGEPAVEGHAVVALRQDAWDRQRQ
jgi:hypothetical protein